ncbi:MAG TPA: ABC transporter permease [Beijerinckiaceae bacterium]|nr:ABC transporter permease [Beijerinckiaceae bacterium]
MWRYALMRIASAIPVILLVTLISFGLMLLIPGDPALVIAGPSATAAEIESVRVQLGLDRPVLQRMLAWYAGLLQGDLGRSLLLGRSVGQAIWERVPVSLSLALLALAITIVLGVLAGVIAAVRQNTWVDQAAMTFAMLGVSLPNFWLALLFIFFFAVHLGWFPTGGYVPLSEDPLGWLRSLILPAVSLALMQIGLLARITRSSMLEVLRQDYIRTARAKGLPFHAVVGRHALRNVLIPLVTVIGITVSLMISGTVVIETVYSLPGIGRLIVSAILQRDYPVIQGGLLLTAVLLVVINLVVDLLYAWLDPRIRYGGRR